MYNQDMDKLIPSLKRQDWLILLAITLIYFGSRLYQLTSLPIFVDEAIYSRWAQISLHDASWRFISLTDGKQPLFMWVAMPFLKLFSDPLFATRFVSVLSGYATVLGLVYAGFLLSGKRLGYYAAALGIITPFLFFYDRFAVVESMLTAAGIWMFCLGFLLSRTRRLDLALILGLAGGLALLVKSPAAIYLLLIPISYPFIAHTKIAAKSTLHFLGLFGIAAVLAYAIYNVQRLSPWMHMIADKNNDFVISPLQMLRENPYRIWQNFVDSQRWLIAYLTLPLYTLVVLGWAKLWWDRRQFFLLSAWIWGPLTALITTALLYRPRYLVFLVPYLLLAGASLLPRQSKSALIVLGLLAILPLRFMGLAYHDPLRMPLHRADWDYTSGWAAGNGVKEIAAYLESRADTGLEIIVGTEGTFGLLPHGLELYTYGTPNLAITGYYPLSQIPPQPLRDQVGEGKEVYFILNNTQVEQTPEGLVQEAAYPKADPSWIRLFRLASP